MAVTRRDDDWRELSRRGFLKSTGLTSLALGTGALAGLPAIAAAAQGTGKAVEGAGGEPYNILFLLTDQERYFDPASLPGNYSLPGRGRLQREGVTFTNHQIGTSVCSSSRSVIYTGQHIQHTKVFDNMGFPWSNGMSPDIPTVGRYMTDAGYHAAYLGKCHFIAELEEIKVDQAPDVNMSELNEIMQRYGFNDYVGVGDILGKTLGGYKSDEFTTSTAIRWLRAETPRLARQKKPWFLSLNLINPHDVMFFNTDAPGAQPVQDIGHLMSINREPNHALYQRTWDMALPESRNEAWDYKGRPRAHYDYQFARRTLVGQFPNEDARWRRLQDYYLNCIADCDRHVVRILRELDELGLTDNTIIVMTSDHGELGGAHQMHGKGATAYKEQVHVPLVVRHPGHAGSAGRVCPALTSHLDITPTILGLAGVSEDKRQAMAPKLYGHDLSGLLASPESAKATAVRESALYNFNMWLFQDADFMRQVYEAKSSGQDVAKLGLKPDLKKRGAIRSVTDGRYRYSRYFSPLQHNLPGTIEQIFEYNDVELFDLQVDPDEMQNLAADRQTNGDLLLAMNQKLTDAINTEVGADDGDFLPKNKAGWAVTHFDP
jgi:arylsulfatase